MEKRAANRTKTKAPVNLDRELPEVSRMSFLINHKMKQELEYARLKVGLSKEAFIAQAVEEKIDDLKRQR